MSFRVAGRTPVIYDAVSNQYLEVKSWFEKNERINLSLKFAANQSLFVIFKKSDKNTKKGNGNNWPTFKTVQDLSKNWKVQLDPTYGGPVKLVLFENLIDRTKHADSTIRYYSGTAIYNSTFNYDGDSKNAWIDLGAFSSMADVKINGISCGTLWTAPFRLNISKAIKKGINQISIEVVNTWANRLIGDSKLTEDKKITKTTAPFRLEGKPLNPAGLFGPVLVQVEE